MRVTNLKHENSASNNIVLNSDGSVGGDLATTLASKLDATSLLGKVLQIVQDTSASNISTSSTSYVDADVTLSITPNATDSGILLLWTGIATNPSSAYIQLQITDSSNNAVSTTNEMGTTSAVSYYMPFICAGYVFPATTSPVTYKGRYKVSSGTGGIQGGSGRTNRLWALEIAA